MSRCVYASRHVWLCMQVCLHTSVHRLVCAKWREKQSMCLKQLESAWVKMNNRSSYSIKTDKWGQESSPKVSAEHFSSHSSTKCAALRSPLLDGAANSFQMNVVYLAYWLNQLLQLAGTSHFPERQIWSFKTGDHFPPPPVQEGITALCEEGRLTLHKAVQLQNHEPEEEMKASSAWGKFLELGWLFLFFFNTNYLFPLVWKLRWHQKIQSLNQFDL